MVERMWVNWQQLEELREVQIRPKYGWPATFGCNDSYQVWPYTTNSRTPIPDRVPLRGAFHLLDEIVKRVVAITIVRGKYPRGGRFSVDDDGVILAKGKERIIEFIFEDGRGYSLER